MDGGDLRLVPLEARKRELRRIVPKKDSPEPFIAEALDVDPQDVYIRIVDVGPGLCAIIRAPGDHFMVYDAGHWVGQHCLAAVRELVTNDVIELLVISHSDGDHLGDAAAILGENAVRLTLLAGEPRDTLSWKGLVAALGTEVTEGGSVHNLQSVPLVPGRTIPLGDATVTLIAGWKEWTRRADNAGYRQLGSIGDPSSKIRAVSDRTLKRSIRGDIGALVTHAFGWE